MNEITGTAGDDVLEGTSGADRILGLAGDDSIYGLDEADSLDGGDHDDFLAGGSGSDILEGGSGRDHLEGGHDRDVLNGGAGDDSLLGGAGDDELDGGTGIDTLVFGWSTAGVSVDLLAGTAVGEGADTLSGIENVEGTDGADSLIGDENPNALVGRGGEDILNGGEGNDDLNAHHYEHWETQAVDRVDGGGGDDNVGVGLNDFADGGTGFDTLEISLFNVAGGTTIDLSAVWSGGTGTNGTGTISGFERLQGIGGSTGNDIIAIGTSGQVVPGIAPPHVLGYAGDDRLTGGGDRDSLHGGDHNDVLIAFGNDDGLSGGDGDDRLEGGEGDDLLVGSSGADVLIGGSGSDTYVYNSDGYADEDEIVEMATDSGIDTILIRPWSEAVPDLAFSGVRNIEVAEIVTLTDIAGTEAILGTEFEKSGISRVIASADIDGSALSAGMEFIVTRPNIRPLTVIGGSGNDVFRFGEDTLPPFVHTYRLAGSGGFDTLYFDQGGDPLLSGFAGGKLLFSDFEQIVLGGGVAAVARDGTDDIPGRSEFYALTLSDEMMAAGTQFIIDATALRPDIAIWLGDDGELGGTLDDEDVIRSDGLVLDVSGLTGGRTVKVLGGAIADDLTGTGGGDAIFGNAGNDELKGSGGADLLDGGDGNDVLIGGEEADHLAGGGGDDLYLVDSSFDRVVELAEQGSDTVRGNANLVLADHVEFLILTGGGNYSGTGNALPNSLTGNGAANRLDGAGGADTMAGGLGHDTYVVDNLRDVVVENGSSGTDTVETSVDFSLPTHFEKLVITGTAGRTVRGNSGDNTISGNAGANTINGGSGNDAIDAGAGNDLVYGHTGNDSLKGGTGLDRFLFNTALGTGNVDRILDFYAPNDTINLARSIFTKAGANGTLSAAAFHQGTSAADAADRIVYDQGTGKIFYDPDGTGAAAQVLFATVTAGTALTSADFVVYG